MHIKDEKTDVDGQALVARDKPQSGSELLSSQHKKRDWIVLTAGEEKRNSSLRKATLSLVLHFHWRIHLGDTEYEGL